MLVTVGNVTSTETDTEWKSMHLSHYMILNHTLSLNMYRNHNIVFTETDTKLKYVYEPLSNTDWHQVWNMDIRETRESDSLDCKSAV